MKFISLVSGIIWNSSILNAVFSLLILPSLLLLLKNFPSFLVILICILLSCLYMVRVYKKQVSGYVYTVGYITAASVFMQVSAGNTVPTWVVISVIGLMSLVSQEILSDPPSTKNESLRQVVTSGVILSSFLFYSFIFGAIYVTILPAWVLMIMTTVFTTGMIWVALNMYQMPYSLFISVIISWMSATAFYVVRFIPYTHTTQAAILSILTFYSLYIYQSLYHVTAPLSRHLLTRLVFVLMMIGILIVTAQ